MAQDVIIETLDALIALLQTNGGVLLPAHRGEAERIARAAWGGERVYIGKLGETGQAQISERDRAIRRDFNRGNHVDFLVRRYGLSRRRIWAIVQPERESAAPAEQTAQAIVGGQTAAACLTGGSAPGDAPQQRPTPRAGTKARAPTT